MPKTETPLTLTEIATYVPECIESFEDENVDDILSKNYKEFLNDNEELQNVRCIIVNTHYTNRILAKLKRGVRISNKTGIAVIQSCNIFDKKKEFTTFSSSPRLLKLTNAISSLHGDGNVTFRFTDADQVYHCVRRLQEMDYCGFCCISSTFKMTWLKVEETEDVILFVQIDTSSSTNTN